MTYPLIVQGTQVHLSVPQWEALCVLVARLTRRQQTTLLLWALYLSRAPQGSTHQGYRFTLTCSLPLRHDIIPSTVPASGGMAAGYCWTTR